ncbi:hypothetical protein C5C39_07240 [Rathayibacter sp. AY1F3]|uniref:phospholipase D family protein n=1 Tax=Rathayibacter sp. AY1F3 TaxID=2080558 RepID=UPI000CE74CC4|nr:phospholipase D family protein [Rathayibacter sp. AY1F3]PPG91352.1 hypothetical protein C5C39_07240 [Rathayibacter sp. AY1F3]
MLHFQTAGAQDGNLLEILLSESIDATRGGGIFAWANASGAITFLGDKSMDELLQKSNFRLIIGTDAITDLRAIDTLAKLSEKCPRLQVEAYLSSKQSLFHPKMAWFEHVDHLSLIVGSGNLTMGGLLSNWEAFVVLRLEGSEAVDALESIERFLSDQVNCLWPIGAEEVLTRVALNTGNERSFRRPTIGWRSEGVLSAIAQTDIALVAEIPKSKKRWSQANFDQENYEQFFGATVGSQKRIVLQHVGADGSIGEIESRPSVEVVSKNYRFELAAARNLPYPDQGRPIGIFVRIETGQFLYSLLMPADANYTQASRFLKEQWSGHNRLMRRVRLNVGQVQASIPELGIWKAGLPEL